MLGVSRGSLRLYVVLILLLTLGFAATSVGSFLSSRDSIRQGITLHELPLTADTVYSEIQKDLIQPVFVSSMMASDTFLRHWVVAGERDVPQMVQYLADIKARFGAVTTFFVSERTRRYYYPEGVLKTVSPSEPRDAWYWRVRTLVEPYETNVDPDLARQDAMTIFINYRVVDFEGHFLGAVGIGLTIQAVQDFVREYQARYDRRVYFVTPSGQVALSAERSRPEGLDLKATAFPWRDVQRVRAGGAVTTSYDEHGAHYLVSIRYLPELKWYLVVEKDETTSLAGVQSTLWVNLSLCLAVTAVVVGLFGFTMGRYQRRLEHLAWTDGLTGLPNRQAVEAALQRALDDAPQTGEDLVLAIVDADHFKAVNDQRGHQAGDATLVELAGHLRAGLREGDLVGRWGGEEFLVLLRRCSLGDGERRLEALRQHVERAPWTSPGGAVTMSVGLAPWRGEALSDWLSRADGALYRAKDAGRNRVEVAP